MQVKGTGVANTCPTLDSGSSNIKDLKAGTYALGKFCMEPTSFTVKEESQVVLRARLLGAGCAPPAGQQKGSGRFQQHPPASRVLAASISGGKLQRPDLPSSYCLTCCPLLLPFPASHCLALPAVQGRRL
jgi:hypothetical protein